MQIFFKKAIKVYVFKIVNTMQIFFKKAIKVYVFKIVKQLYFIKYTEYSISYKKHI